MVSNVGNPDKIQVLVQVIPVNAVMLVYNQVEIPGHCIYIPIICSALQLLQAFYTSHGVLRRKKQGHSQPQSDARAHIFYIPIHWHITSYIQ